MNRLAVSAMQPYLFPYLGYFQLIDAADHHVVADDFPWVDRGWINRNRILTRDGELLFTFPVEGADRETPIKDRLFTTDFDRQRTRLLRRVRDEYRRAPAIEEVLDLMERALPPSVRRLGDVLPRHLGVLCAHLGIDTPHTLSSMLDIRRTASRSDAPIAMLRALGGTAYLNAIRGGHLYDAGAFAAAGLSLELLEHDPVPYDQGREGPFVPRLSIIDVLMWNDSAAIRRLLDARRIDVATAVSV